MTTLSARRNQPCRSLEELNQRERSICFPRSILTRLAVLRLHLVREWTRQWGDLLAQQTIALSGRTSEDIHALGSFDEAYQSGFLICQPGPECRHLGDKVVRQLKYEISGPRITLFAKGREESILAIPFSAAGQM